MGLFTKEVVREVVREVVPKGYIHESEVRDLQTNPYSEDEIISMASEILRDMYGEKLEKTVERKLFDQLILVEGFNDYLRTTMARDLQRHFVASTPIEQMNIRGAFARTLYFRSLMTKKKPKLESKRYAK